MPPKSESGWFKPYGHGWISAVSGGGSSILLLQKESYPTILPRANSGGFVGQGMNFPLSLSSRSAPFPPEILGSCNEKATDAYGVRPIRVFLSPVSFVSFPYFYVPLLAFPSEPTREGRQPGCHTEGMPYIGAKRCGMCQTSGGNHFSPLRS